MHLHIMKTRHVSELICSASILFALAACSNDTTNAIPPAPASLSLNVQTDHQTGPVGTLLAAPVSVHVTDANGNIVTGGVVTWTVSSGGGSVDSATTPSNANGDASVRWTLGTVAGTNTLTGALSNGATATATATATPGALTSIAVVSGNAQNVTAGSATAPLVVKVTDGYGNALPGSTVTWAVTGGGTLSGSTSSTDATGSTQVTLATDPAPASYTVTATVGGLPAAVFTVTGS